MIVPDFGGFIAHHVEARYDADEKLWLPPFRTLGFNQQLRLNDSLLAQSYVDAYDITDYAGSDPVNQALSAGNVCLYGLAAAVIAALGLSPGLGFVHVGHTLSFAYDIADLYKAETSIPLAFALGSKHPPEIGSEMRRQMRDVFAKTHLIERMVKDIKTLLQTEETGEPEPLYLWDDKKGAAAYGVSYGKDSEA